MRSKRIPAEEQYRLIMECRQSGLTDHQWCVEHDIKPGTFYNWVKRLRQKGCVDLPASTGRAYRAPESQEVVRVDFHDTDPIPYEQPLNVIPEATERNNLSVAEPMKLSVGSFHRNNTKWNRSSASGSNASHCEGVGMLGDITAADEIYIVTGRTDMRKSIDGLCAVVEDQLHMDPRRSALYLFCGKRCDRIKALLWESDGFVLLYKRMEVQGRFRWPRNQLEVKQLTCQQFDWLMSGLEIEQPKAFKPTE